MTLLQEARADASEQPGDTEMLSEPSQSLHPCGTISPDAEASTSSLYPSIIPEKPNHPVISFPQRSIGRQKRSFCSSWYAKYPWLHYQESSDSVLCFYCHVAERRHLPVSLNKDDAFTKMGFINWKKAIERFNKHEKTVSHHQAVEKIPRTSGNVGDMLSSDYKNQKPENREMLQIILSSIRFLSRQGLSLRGRFKTADVAGEVDSNFVQLLKTIAEDNPNILKWMDRARDKFTCPDIQNEILCIMAQYIQREMQMFLGNGSLSWWMKRLI